jgi:uncharacterized protein (TIGR03083 family)
MSIDTHAATDARPAPMIEAEYLALAELLNDASADVWDAPSLCEGWRTREVVAHMTMPARYDLPSFMAELDAAGGDFTRLSNTVADRDGRLPEAELVAGLRSPVLHAWEPPGGAASGALTHCVIHGLDITEALGWDRRVPAATIVAVLQAVAEGANLFGADLSGLELRADDVDWSAGAGYLVTGPAQVLALVACGRLVPAGRLGGRAARRFTR